MYSTTMKIVHQPTIHNFLPRTTTRKARSPPLLHNFSHLPQPINLVYRPIRGTTWGKIYLWVFCTPKFGTKQINHGYLAWQQLATEPTSCRFTFPPVPHTSAAAKDSAWGPRTAILQSYTTLPYPKSEFLSSLSNSFLQFQLVFLLLCEG